MFNRPHPIEPPGDPDELPVVIEDNPSKDMVFPASSQKIVERIRSLPEQHVVGITHLWMHRAKPGEREAGGRCWGSLVRWSGHTEKATRKTA